MMLVSSSGQKLCRNLDAGKVNFVNFKYVSNNTKPGEIRLKSPLRVLEVVKVRILDVVTNC